MVAMTKEAQMRDNGGAVRRVITEYTVICTNCGILKTYRDNKSVAVSMMNQHNGRFFSAGHRTIIKTRTFWG